MSGLNTYKIVKGEFVRQNVLAPISVCIRDDILPIVSNMRFTFFALGGGKANDEFSFLFAFSGMGRHYRIVFDYVYSCIRIILVRDGVNVYLHHLTCVFAGRKIDVDFLSVGIRIRLDSTIILCAHDKELVSGCFGFLSGQNELFIPDVLVTDLSVDVIRTLIFGDGFGNARWFNRDFVSWPEILFNRNQNMFNFCVAAGNSSRTLSVLNDTMIAEPSLIIVMTGNDDAMESLFIDNYIFNLEKISHLIPSSSRLLVCSLTPRKSNMTKISSWNSDVKKFCEEKCIDYIDVFSPLLNGFKKCVSLNDYPNEHGQKIIASTIGHFLNNNSNTENIIEKPHFSYTHVLRRKLLRKLHFSSGKLLKESP